MRVYDLAKELGKDSSKEILDILEKHDINLKSSSNISDDQASIVRKAMGGAGKSSEGRQNAPASEKPAGDDSARTDAGAGEPHKKKIAAVFRPQNAQMKPQRQQGQGNRDGRPQGQGYQGNRDGRPQNQGGSYEQRTAGNNTVSGQSVQPREAADNTVNTQQAPQSQTAPVQPTQTQPTQAPQTQAPAGQSPQAQPQQTDARSDQNSSARPQGQGYQGNRDGRPQGQ
ncbi:MAG: translation initiation factor IF-2 N-terminal domain-containing protein, partial [Hungatella sp.]|uniref:translation initiation factor IF-2 N-terminal domain-containing protein n=1 Tax=Hungatella sp. TaxID=2613924 RepID=UPI0039969550